MINSSPAFYSQAILNQKFVQRYTATFTIDMIEGWVDWL